ncbi:hypothetical protein IC235_12650 [Hymenobacter sp. BT664]|uniref:Outer membrane protein beta-barrel domain-containing protein n=1 Tax=Hymenobacter montanus TaxID=2771359 RepID=A0A927BE60_9BACT|nr:hypothetical protein [Hymenobacter montanus]MBD2768736.1 hypothetical protein [Hymenobacter montanus]
MLHNCDFTQTGGNDTQSTKNTSTDDLNKVVIGYVAGIGYQITSGLSLGLRYSGDISQVYKDGASRAYAFKPGSTQLNGNNPNVHNSVFQFQVIYSFSGQ